MDDDMAAKLGKTVARLEGEMVECLSQLVRRKTLGPANGGDGELGKVLYLEELVAGFGFARMERVDSPDDSAPGGARPNLIVTVDGRRPESEGVIWMVAHTDIVPEGDLAKWTSPPYEPEVRDGKLHGRGAEDNCQDLVASLYALKALADMGLTPERCVRLAFVADEETGSVHGIQHLIARGLFRKEDLIVVPDFGESDGAFMEVAEKSIVWLKVTVEGKSVHASMPQLGVNASRVGMKYALALDGLLHGKYDQTDELFLPAGSTFEPTKREANVDNVNTIPGLDVSYFDCRVLPRHDMEEVLSDARELADRMGGENGAKITVELQQGEQAAPPTAPDSPVVERLGRAIAAMTGTVAKPGGIGGGTCGAFFRREGLDAVVWATLEETGHQPDEYARISNMVSDAKVFAGFYMGL